MSERFQQRRAEFDKALRRLTMALAQERNEYTQDAVILVLLGSCNHH